MAACPRAVTRCRLGPRRPRPRHLGAGVELLAAAGHPERRRGPRRHLFRRQHLRPGAAHARLFRALHRAVGPGAARVRAHGQRGALLQPALSLDVRALGARRVSVRPRAHRQPRGWLQRGPAVRVRTVPLSAVVAPAGAVVAVDAVGPLRLPPLLRHRPAPRARGRRGRTDRAEPFVRLLPALLLALRRRLHPGGDGGAWAVALGARVAGPHRRGHSRHGAHGTVLPAVSRTQGAPAVHTDAGRSGPLLGGHLLLLDGVRGASDVGPGRAGVSEARGAALSWTRGAPARGDGAPPGHTQRHVQGCAPTRTRVEGMGRRGAWRAGGAAPGDVRPGAVRPAIRVRSGCLRAACERRHAAAASRRRRLCADPDDQPSGPRAACRALVAARRLAGRAARGAVAVARAVAHVDGPPARSVRAVSRAVRVSYPGSTVCARPRATG